MMRLGRIFEIVKRSARWLRGHLLTGRRGSYWKSVLRIRFVVVAMVLMLFGGYISHLWLFDIASHAATGAMMAAAPQTPARYIRTVEIDQADYTKLFNATSPLCPIRLQELLDALIVLKPLVIVVDIDTSAPSFRNLHLPVTDIPIVWARDFSDRELKPMPVLGSTSKSPPYWGFVNYKASPDGYYSEFSRKFDSGVRSEDMLHFAAVRAYCGRQATLPVCSHLNEQHENSLLAIDPHSEIESISARELMDEKKDFDSNPGPNKTSEIFTGRLVFLGGNYLPADQCQTYLGSMPCVRLMALAAESEMDGRRLPRPPEFASKLLEIGLSLIIASMYYYLRPMPAMLTTFFVLTLLIAYANYKLLIWGLSIDFIPFAVGIWLELMVRSGEEKEA